MGSSNLQFLKYSILLLVALHPQQSIQQTTIQATCSYSYYDKIHYTCYLTVSGPVSSKDVLNITGTHLQNHTDADVEAVIHPTKFNTTFNGKVLRKFENLKNLEVNGRNFLEVNPNAFEVCPKLERLIISSGLMKALPPAMLKNCENLVYFEAMSQMLETLPEDLFGNTRSLEKLAVPFNKLTSLPEKLLWNMQKLKAISIGFNNLKELSSIFLIHNPNLEEASLFYNKFEDQGDVTYALNGHPNLKRLWINDNNFSNFDFRFFTQFQKLEYLSVGIISGTELINIYWPSLPASLAELSVREIGENIPENAFERLVDLRTLTLSGMGIEILHKDTFKSLTSLVNLYIYDSSLKSLHPELFTSQINLSHLLITNSQIEELPPGIFAPLISIGTVNKYTGIQIPSAKLQRLNANSFGEHPHLQNIDFSSNDINEIERGIFSKFHPVMSFAGFSKNKCVSDYLSGENLDDSEQLEICFKNWEDTEPNNGSNK